MNFTKRARMRGTAVGVTFGRLGLAHLGSGQTLTIPVGLARLNALVVVVTVESPGQRTTSELAYAWIDLSVGGSGSAEVIRQGAVTKLAAGIPPVPQVASHISGSAVEGRTLTASPGTWTENPTTFTYQWIRGATAIAGATGRTYKLTAADVGKKISVQVNPVKTGHVIVALTSSSTATAAKATAVVSAKVAMKKVKKGKKAAVTVK